MNYQDVCSIHVQVQVPKHFPKFEESFLLLTLMSLRVLSSTYIQLRKHVGISQFRVCGHTAEFVFSLLVRCHWAGYLILQSLVCPVVKWSGYSDTIHPRKEQAFGQNAIICLDKSLTKHFISRCSFVLHLRCRKSTQGAVLPECCIAKEAPASGRSYTKVSKLVWLGKCLGTQCVLLW